MPCPTIWELPANRAQPIFSPTQASRAGRDETDERPKTGVSIGSAEKRYGEGVALHDVSFDASDRVAVLKIGRLVQIGTPEGRYVRPCNAWWGVSSARRRG